MSIFARRLAAVVSWIGHPLAFITISVAIVLAVQSQNALSLLLTIFLAVIAPMGVLLFLGVRSGRWSDADVSVREERKRFYPIAIPLSAAGTLGMWLANAPRYILRGGIVMLALLIVAAVINLRFKLSLHTMFAAYCTMILFRVNAFCGIFALTLAALVFWSRLFLTRHTLPETIVGAALGSLGGFVAAWMSI
jgi:hypothetical protein